MVALAGTSEQDRNPFAFLSFKLALREAEAVITNPITGMGYNGESDGPGRQFGNRLNQDGQV